MTKMSLVRQSLRFYWRGHLGLLGGVFLAAMVLCGSLLVGDSVRASLRRAAEARLGAVQMGVLGGERWFSEDLVGRVDGVPLVMADAAVSSAGGQVRVNAVQVLGVNETFWQLSPGGRELKLERGEVVVNAVLAGRLGVEVGEMLVVRMERPSAISRDAPLSGSTQDEVTLRRKVVKVVGAEDFGAFNLVAVPGAVATVYLNLEDLQGQLEMEGRVNVMLHAGVDAEDLMGRMDAEKGLADFSLKLDKVGAEGAEEWQVGTDRVFLDEVLAERLLDQEGAYGVLGYLVNGLFSAQGGTPYSMVSAVDPGVLKARFGVEPGQGEAVISEWLAEDQKLEVGDEVSASFFVVGNGRKLEERKQAFTVAGVVKMTEPQLNRSWTPRFPGVSDVDNCRDWEPGIPMDMQAIRDQDEKYWDDYGETPKMFVRLDEGQGLWENRFGRLTSVRFADDGRAEAEVAAELVAGLSLVDVGLAVRPLRVAADSAARGSVDFGGLFVGLSLFLIAGALVFAALLFVFLLERRVEQMGLLLAFGWEPAAVRAVLLFESGLIALVAVVLGVFAGEVYTRLALMGLGGVWADAAGGLQLVYEGRPGTMILAGVLTWLLVLGVLWRSTRFLLGLEPRSLLGGGHALSGVEGGVKTGRSGLKAVVCAVLALGLAFVAGGVEQAELLAGLFFGAGCLLLAAGLFALRRWMLAGLGGGVLTRLSALSLRAIGRRPGRSLAVVGMMAGGIFLVTAVNAFRLNAEVEPGKRDSGTGGFALVGESSLPVYEALDAEEGREAYGLDEEVMSEVRVVPMRVLDGDDASCLNLNRAQRPVLVGVNAGLLAERQAFVFAAGKEVGWGGLQQALPEAVPAVVDQATAMWGLGKGLGDRLQYEDAQGRGFEVEIVGLLAGSVLQGKVLIDESAFLLHYPNAPGYRFFLVDAPADVADGVSAFLTRQLEKRGLALESAGQRVQRFLAVQNTYIGIFTVLGGLGVLLGTAGLGVLVARHVLERRGELGLMLALGFRPGVLRGLVLNEHLVLLVLGLVLGALCALLAVWPSVQQRAESVPWTFLSGLWVSVLLCGALVCYAAVLGAVKGRLLDAIRRE